MVFARHRHNLATTAALLLLCSGIGGIHATTITTSPQAAPSPPATCEFRTINYITDSLPQLCGKSSWSSTNLTSATRASDESRNPDESSTSSRSDSGQPASVTISSTLQQESAALSEPVSSTSNPPTPPATAEEGAASLEGGELNEASFISFEDWKKQTLEKAGQANANIGHKRSGEKKRDSEGIQNNLDSLGEEGEIDLDFGAFRSGGQGEEQSQAAETRDGEAPQNIQGDAARQYRSKDAGKTCKERFSYASFDAGATILKTHPGAKNPKAVLIENKDSYMLSECKTDNKFLIIELSEDILIDTLVLANYEFFSSMIRNFRVSVSDKYPVKMDKWKVVGTYEARNSREIQAFLIENPQIWARYIRIEFLSHYGNEYYCPLSLVRVHGTRMLESWKETEAIGDDDDSEDGEEQSERFVPDAVADVVQEEERLNAELKEAQAAIQEPIKTAEVIANDKFETNSSHLLGVNRSLETASSQHLSSAWVKLPSTDLFDLSPAQDTCPIGDAPLIDKIAPVIPHQGVASNSTIGAEHPTASTLAPPLVVGSSVPPIASSSSHAPDVVSKGPSTQTESSSIVSSSPNITRTATDSQYSSSSIAASATSKQSITSQRNKTTSTSSASSSLPTVQESFFKAVSRRLQLLETNSTLSLGYIEQQSKILREAFSKVEKKQLQKTTTFLDTLNSTVLAELRVFRQQYDEIWQSTVISLESQREESRREILAISARLNILADEVVFQKRMSIVQSVLLLLCLGLVIFSRVSGAGQLDLPSLQSRARAFGFPLSPLESPPESPEFRRSPSARDREGWLDLGHRNQRSEGSPISLSRRREDSPPTPVSTDSKSDNALTPPSRGDDLASSTGNSDYLELPHESRGTKSQPSSWQGSSDIPEDGEFVTSPPVRTPRTRNAFINQQPSPPESGLDDAFENSHGLDGPSPHYLTSTRQEHTVGEDASSHLPSPLRDSSFSIARKPLPALPIDD